MTVVAEVAAAAGPALAEHVRADPGPARFEPLVDDPGRLFVLEAVYEGYLMHYGAPRAFERLEPDLALLAGDALYALGLERLAAAGDLEAIAELSDLISGTARAHAEGDPERAEMLWEASARRLGRDRLPGAS